MPSEGQRLHGFAVVSRTLKLGRQLLVPAIFGGASAGSSLGGGAFTWILVLASLPSLLIAIGQWWAFRFRLADHDLVIDSGLLRRQRRVIPLARVQNIDLEQSFLERLVGVAELRMETASGGRETEASLQVLALGEAQELQATLLRRRAAALTERDPDRGSRPHDPATATPVAAVTGTDGRGAGTDDLRGEAPDAIPGAIPGADTGAGAATGGQPRVLLRLGLADLAIAGATSNEAGLIAAGLATLLEIAPDLLGVESLVESIGIPDLGFRGILFYGALVTVGFVVAGWLVSIAATMVRFYGFTLSRSGDDLRKEYGLFSRHRSTIPLARVQAVRIEETLLRRPLGLAALKIETAGAGPQRKEQQGGRSEAFVPLARHRDVGRLL
ncbi:MAG TPA: PH domain-containing protein, partial [Longimicrobiales bacterium]|nr:PH domain-containing protein [Longimicrobiales bacterium]